MANRPPGSNTVAVSSGLSHNAGHKKMTIPAGYLALLDGIKQRIRAAQVRAMLSTNAELIHLYWDIGRVIDQRQRQEGWGAGVIPRLAIDLLNELPAVKGFLQRNIKRMLAFYSNTRTPDQLCRSLRHNCHCHKIPPLPVQFCRNLRQNPSMPRPSWQCSGLLH